MEYKREKCLKIATLSVFIALLIYLLIGSLLLFTIYGGEGKVTSERADYNTIVGDFKEELKGCYDAFLATSELSTEYSNSSRVRDRDWFLSCSGDSASVLAASLFHPYHTRVTKQVSLLQTTSAAIGLTLSFDESHICVEEQTDRNCLFILAIISVFGIIFNAILAVLVSILASTRLAFLADRIPFKEICKQVVTLSFTWIILEISAICITSMMVFLVISIFGLEETFYFDNLIAVMNYFVLSHAKYDEIGTSMVIHLAITDISLKLAAVFNFYLTLTMLLLVLRRFSEKYKSAFISATLGSTSTCACCSRPRKAAEMYNGTLTNGNTLPLPLTLPCGNHTQHHHYRTLTLTASNTLNNTLNLSQNTLVGIPGGGEPTDVSPIETSNKSTNSGDFLSSGSHSEHQLNTENHQARPLPTLPRTSKGNNKDSPDHRYSTSPTSVVTKLQPGSSNSTTPEHLSYPVPMHEMDQIYAEWFSEELSDYYSMPEKKARLAQIDSCQNSSTNSSLC